MNTSFRTRSILSILLSVSCVSAAFAQDEADALRFSMIQPQATARAVGIGNALGSIGGEFSSLSVNPAGIGIYRSSELIFTPNLIFNSTNTQYTGTNSSENGSHFAISNAGFVTTKLKDGRHNSGWTSFSFAFGINRLADFTRDYQYHGTNTTSSGSFVFEADANAYGVSSSGSITSPGDLGYQSYLLDTLPGSGYISVVNPTAQSPVGQNMVVKERGGNTEMIFSFGGAYQEKLMLGATVGVPFVRYVRERNYSETDLSGNPNNNFDYYTYYEDLHTNGVGINLKIGAIYKLSDNFRLGAAIHTPTYYTLHDIFNSGVTANTEFFTQYQPNTAVAVENHYDYNLTTPWRAVVSGTVLLGGKGFFTLDYEYVDYNSAKFKFGPTSGEQDYEHFINSQIRNKYRAGNNIRTGVEIRLDPVFLRGGYGFYGSPYVNNTSYNRMDFSLGLGWRVEKLFLDFGYLHRSYKEDEQPYVLPDNYKLTVPTATMSSNANMFVLTMGVKF
jgi:hypothetical protein